MRYRKLDENGDYVFGRQQADFWRDVPEAPAQAVWTRLQMQYGEWFLDTTDGTPWKTRVLGKYTGSTRDPVIRARILGTEGVTEIVSYFSDLDRNTRKFFGQAEINTIYGRTMVQGPI